MFEFPSEEPSRCWLLGENDNLETMCVKLCEVCVCVFPSQGNNISKTLRHEVLEWKAIFFFKSETSLYFLVIKLTLVFLSPKL